MLTQKAVQKKCMHIYDDYASELVGKNIVKIWRKCRICFKEFTYLRRAKP